MEPTYRIQAKDLDVTTNGNATRLEIAYADERRHIPLKGKYRPKRGSLPQWGTGGDYGSRKNNKTDSPQAMLGRSIQHKPRKMVLVIGPTGKRTMVEEG